MQVSPSFYRRSVRKSVGCVCSSMKDRKSREATQSAWTQWLRGLRFVDEQGCVILHVIHCGGIAGVNVDLSTFLFLLLCVHKQSSLACVFALEGKKRAPALLRATMTPARCGSCTLCSPPPPRVRAEAFGLKTEHEHCSCMQLQYKLNSQYQILRSIYIAFLFIY